MFSFKKWAASASAACLLLSLSVAPLFSQAAAEQKQPQAKTKAEIQDLAQRKLTAMSENPELLRGIYYRCCVADLLS